MDLKLDSTGDIEIAAGEMSTVVEAEEVAQRLCMALDIRRGEWVLNLGTGLPWVTDDGTVNEDTILRKAPNLQLVNATIRNVIANVEGVSRVVSYEGLLDDNRLLTVTFEVETTTGEIIAGALSAEPEGAAGSFQVITNLLSSGVC